MRCRRFAGLRNDYIVGEDLNGNGIVATRLDLLRTGGVEAFRNGGVKIFTAEYHKLATRDVALGQHVCYKSGDWALISHYDHRRPEERAADPTNSNYDVTFDELVLAKLDGTQIKRVAKTHVKQWDTNAGQYMYECLPMASLSPDGNYVVFNTTNDVENGETSVVVTKIGGAE